MAKGTRQHELTEIRQRARERGQRYYTGSPCKHCGGTLRFTSVGNCVRFRSHNLPGRS